MATAADENGKSRRLELLSKIDIEININDAILLTTEDGVITGLDDRYVFFLLICWCIPKYDWLLEHYEYGYDDKQANIGHPFAIH